MKLKNKVVIVTGGGRGIGKFIAEILAQDGAKIIICARTEKDLKRVCRSIQKIGGECDYRVVDVTKKSQVGKFLESILLSHKKIDVLINNAGWSNKTNYIENITDGEYKTCFANNVDSIFYFLRKIIPIMKRQNNGMIINISSMAGKNANPLLPVYSATKFAVQGFTESVAKELKELNYNVSCISICPGGVNTGMRAKLFGNIDAKRQQSAEIVAITIRNILTGNICVPNGASVYINKGKLSGIDDTLANLNKREFMNTL